MQSDFGTIKDILDIVLTFFLTVATVYLAIYTYRLVDEARKARKAQVQPYISIHLEQAETDPTLLFIIIKNIGQGSAYDLVFDIKKDFGSFGQEAMKIGDRGLFKEGMKICPPGYSKKYFLTETRNDYDKKMSEELIFIAKYKNLFKEDIREEFLLRLSEQRMHSSISPADTYIGRITEYMKEIKQILEHRNS